ncbi:MAG: hypothetical protein JNL79_08475 [Myxococcales bacterium]|nr:hypothetical protein [Myxococcales bacterium]
MPPRADVQAFCEKSETRARSCGFEFDADKCAETAPVYDAVPLLEGTVCSGEADCDVFAACVKKSVSCSSSFLEAPPAHRCVGVPTECRLLTMAHCEKQRGCSALRTSDPKLDECRGYQTSCETFSNPTDCGAQAGCNWK